MSYPILRYSDFIDFILEMDTSIQGLGAILGQEQNNGVFPPIAYDS